LTNQKSVIPKPLAAHWESAFSPRYITLAYILLFLQIQQTAIFKESER